MMDPRWDLWKTKEPSADFADRVLLAVDRDVARLARRRRVLAWTAAVSAPIVFAAAAWALWLHRGALATANRTADASEKAWPLSGECSANARTELELRPGMSAVLEQGAHVRWNADRIDQDRGDVFYRASRSEMIRVRTPAAEISGRGPAYRVKVPDTVEGAPPSVLVSVAQGRVAIESAGMRHALGAGQYARVEHNSLRTDREDEDGEIALALASDRVRNVVHDRLRSLERRALAAEAEAAPAITPSARPPRRSASPIVAPRTERPISSASPPRTPILPRCDCDPRSPLCSCGSE